MKHRTRVFLLIVCVALWLVCLSTVVYAEGASTELVVLSTTDMHGKCWETNLLTGGKVTQNMLRVSTAVQQIREAYGRGQVILIDNGDLFQGTPISEEHLLRVENPEDEPEGLRNAACACWRPMPATTAPTESTSGAKTPLAPTSSARLR